MLDLHFDRAVGPAVPTLGPLDGGDAGAGDEVFETEIGNLFRLEPIEIDVMERDAAGVFLDQREGRARDVIRVGPDAARETANEGGLAGTELAEQQHDVPGLQRGAETLAGRRRVFFALA